MTSNPVSVIVMIVLAAFVIDRIVAAILFLISFNKSWATRFPDPASVESPEPRRTVEKKQKLIYFVLATLFAFVFLLSFKQVGVIKALGFHQADPVEQLQRRGLGLPGRLSRRRRGYQRVPYPAGSGAAGLGAPEFA